MKASEVTARATNAGVEMEEARQAAYGAIQETIQMMREELRKL